jgi:uncharacterized radical SAM superfamily Fe-S cluster-containing enzyme
MKTKKIICPMCKGNGFTRHKFEAESSVIQCKTCKSEGELEDKYYLQTYLDSDNNPIWYHGPLHLSTDSLKKFKIHLK